MFSVTVWIVRYCFRYLLYLFGIVALTQYTQSFATAMLLWLLKVMIGVVMIVSVRVLMNSRLPQQWQSVLQLHRVGLLALCSSLQSCGPKLSHAARSGSQLAVHYRTCMALVAACTGGIMCPCLSDTYSSFSRCSRHDRKGD